MKTVSASEARRRLSKLLRDVSAGETVVVTLHGEPVAQIVPALHSVFKREQALICLLARLNAQSVLDLPRIGREEMYQE
jgi:prevent-host-death family protein